MKRLSAFAGLFVASQAWGNHPLITEDTGVLGKGGWQLELHGERSRDRAGGVTVRKQDPSAALSYGVSDQADLQFELPYLREVTDGDVVRGRGDASASVKWRFYEKDGVSLLFKPDLILPTGRDELGLGAGRVNWAANLVVGYTTGNFEVYADAGYTRNHNRTGERDALRHLSAALLWGATEKLKLVLDLSRDTNPDPGPSGSPRVIVYGVTYGVTEKIDLGLGVQEGLNDAADDRALRAGLKIRW